jgi:dTDP-4-amino-4,6-dideoxygalactose transaminase
MSDLQRTHKPIPFVEDKVPDWTRVQQLLAISARTERWTNFGPVQNELANLVYEMIGHPDGKAVVTASSATSALHALVGSYAEKATRPLIWAVCAFGFFSTRIGPLANHVQVVDCDENGLLDLAELAALPLSCWDGLIITDIFGMQPDLSPYMALCESAGKPMIVDAAVAFPARRSPALNASEIVSFHHTKPWGFGEGGCLIVDRAQENTARSLLNFGVHLDSSLAPFASNGKMSDPAAALIYQRVEKMPLWAAGYQRQRQRIIIFAKAAGLKILTIPPDGSVTPHVPVLAPHRVILSDLPELPFAVAKYYPPLNNNCPNAMDIYSRMVAVPSHPGMAAVEDSALEQFFFKLATAESR